MAQRRKTPGDRILGKPTTGDGENPGQKPKLSETNLGGKAPSEGRTRGLRIPQWLIGKHRRSE